MQGEKVSKKGVFTRGFLDSSRCFCASSFTMCCRFQFQMFHELKVKARPWMSKMAHALPYRSCLEAAKGLRSVSAQMEAAQGRLQQAQQNLYDKGD